MKSQKTLIAALILAAPLFASAHGNKMEMISLAVQEALLRFNAEEGPAAKRDFEGVKAWISGSLAKVKVLVKNTDGKTYDCKMNHADGSAEAVSCVVSR